MATRGLSWLRELISFIKCVSVCMEVRGNLQELVLSSSTEGTKDRTQVVILDSKCLCFIEPSPQARTVFFFFLMKEQGGVGKGEGRGRGFSVHRILDSVLDSVTD